MSNSLCPFNLWNLFPVGADHDHLPTLLFHVGHLALKEQFERKWYSCNPNEFGHSQKFDKNANVR
jgi:hypothetical protein